MTDQSRSPAEADPALSTDGTVTLLFSDMEGSTRLLRALGPRYADVLLDQRRILRAAFASHGGREIDTAGDGCFVVFRTARDAVAAAVAAQRALSAQAWPEGAQVRVRMGLHTGEPTVTATGDLVGIDVHRAARICSVAHGGQVLLSAITRQLIAGELPAGVSIAFLGDCRLKDIEHPEPLHQLEIDGLVSVFPPIVGAAHKRSNLAVPTTPLIGRERDVDAVIALLTRDRVRLVTLTGPAGTGKTRLALEAAQKSLDVFRDGVFFVQLAPITNPSLLAPTIASALGLVEKPGQPILDVLEAYLERQEMLLVLDNFEQIAAAAPVVAGLLGTCQRLHILVTSQILLHVSAEHEYPVSPLSTPGQNEYSIDDLATVPAVRLFVERARVASAGFSLNDQNAAAVARICRQLEGLPLAIELAATRIRLFPPATLADRLTDRLNLLKGGSRDAPERHQTLRHALQWSYELLGRDARRVLRQLGVFTGDAPFEAIEAVCGEDGGDPLEHVGALLDHSLLRRDTDADGEPRFVMLDTIREFALERLSEDNTALEAARRRHASWYLGLAEKAAGHLTGPEVGQWMRRLDSDRENLRAALQWSLDSGDADIGLRLATALWRYWNSVGRQDEAKEWLERVLAIPGAGEPTPERARALHGLATMTHVLSSFAAGIPAASECLELYRSLGDEEGIATILNTLGWILAGKGDIAASVAHSTEALERHSALGDRRGMAVALNNLGFAIRQTSDLDAARDHYERSLAVRREIRDRRGVAYGLTNLAYLEQDTGRYELADEYLDEAITILRDIGDDQLAAWALSHKARGALDRADLDAADVLLEESLRLWQEVNNQTGLGWTWTLRGALEITRGSLGTARTALEQAHRSWSQTGIAYGIAICLVQAARLEWLAGNWTVALDRINESLEISGSVGFVIGSFQALEVKAWILASSDNHADALEAVALLGRLDHARTVRGTRAAPSALATTRQVLAKLVERVGSAAFDEAWARDRRDGRAESEG